MENVLLSPLYTLITKMPDCTTKNARTCNPFRRAFKLFNNSVEYLAMAISREYIFLIRSTGENRKQQEPLNK